MPEEEILWKDRKHHMWFPFSFTKYSVTKTSLQVQQGFFKTSYDETLLYRIVDLRLSRTLAQKIFGTGTIELFTRVDTQH
ncbi:MAG: PH domain-containing protein, partial [Lachnospiraceae bacterium]|nr:PH domain-containing protein [Lachnospiraceae bacterium]